MEVEIPREDSPLLRDVSDEVEGEEMLEAVKTPRHATLSADAPFLCVERLMRVDHGVDGDTKEKNPIISLAVSPSDDRLLATGGLEGGVRVWRLSPPGSAPDPIKKNEIPASLVSQVTTLLGHAGQVNAVRFSPTGALLASASADTTVRVYATHGSSWKMVHCLRFHSLDVTDLAWFSPTVLVSTSTDRNTVVWDATTGGRMQTLYSDKGSCPKGVSVDPKGEYLSVLFDEGLVDIYRRNSDGKFRLSRHLDLAKDDPANFAKAFRTTLYARRAAWTPDGQKMVFPLGARGRLGPCGVEYERLNFMDPTPGETLSAAKVMVGHPSRVVVTSVLPRMLIRGADDSASTADAFYVTALASVDGVVSFWASNSEKPVAVVANVTGPLRVCTDAAWAENTLLLSASDGSVTAIRFFNIGTPIAVGKPSVVAAAAGHLPSPTQAVGGDVKSAQVEVRVGGKRKIQPVVASADLQPFVSKQPVASPPEVRSVTAASTVTVRNHSEGFRVAMSGTEIFEAQGAVSSVAHADNLIVLGCVKNEEASIRTLWRSVEGQWEPRGVFVLLPEPVRNLTLTADGYLSFAVGSSSICLWKLVDNEFEAVFDDIQIDGIAKQEMIENIQVADGVPTLVLKTGKTIEYNQRLHRWTLTMPSQVTG